MFSLLSFRLIWRRTLPPLTLFLTVTASILVGGVPSQARAASDVRSQATPDCTKSGAQVSTSPLESSSGGKRRKNDPTVGWMTSGTQIATTTGVTFTIAGINWYGFETTGFVAHGLYAQDYPTILNSIKQCGYNTIRIPFSNQMWETDPVPNRNTVGNCPSCKDSNGNTFHSRDILAKIINYAGSIGLHIILDNHRSEAGNSAEANGLWYNTSHQPYTEQSWISDWKHIQQWVNGVRQPIPGTGMNDVFGVNNTASDTFPVVLGYDLRDEPHTPSRTPYLQGATWGTGDTSDPNPNPFSPSCVALSTCHDWRLAAERAADTLLGDAALPANNWPLPLIFVEGISQYPTAQGTVANGPYDFYWWGGNLLGVNGNSAHPGAPIVLNVLHADGSLGSDADSQLVYSAHDYGPSVFGQGWFNGNTCYTSTCPGANQKPVSSLALVWRNHWAYINVAGGVNPYDAGGNQSSSCQTSTYPWSSTGNACYSQAPMYLGEFGTGNNESDLTSTVKGSEGQWFTDLVNFIQSSYKLTSTNPSGIAVTNLQWTYWALNTEDSFALLGSNYTGLANPDKEYMFLCWIQQASVKVSPVPCSNSALQTPT